MSFKVPAPPDRYELDYFNRTFSSIETAINARIPKIEATDSVLLLSPSGSVYKVTVSDAGVLTTTAVALGQTGAPPY
jgi:hypothetical protein